MPLVDSLAHQRTGPMFALAGFARVGNARALDALGRALDDGDVGVRESALTAIVRGLPPELALQTLQARVPTLTHADVRDFAGQLIARLQHRVPSGSQ